MLFLKAIYDITDNQNIKNEIQNEFLTINGTKKLKLKLITSDNEVFEKLLNDCEIDKNCLSKIYLNYKCMLEYLKNSSHEILSYYKTFKKLLIVYIELHKEVDNSQLIYESINTPRHTLSQGDLIRNYILMNKNHTEQTYLYNNYWSKIEKHINHNNITLYITDYLTMKEHKITKQDDVYNSFKNYIIKNKIKTEELLSDLLHYSEIYSMISEQFTKYKKLNH